MLAANFIDQSLMRRKMSDIKLNYHKTHFLTSAPNLKSLPEDSGIEIAFAGRSNAGKSTALNALTNQKT